MNSALLSHFAHTLQTVCSVWALYDTRSLNVRCPWQPPRGGGALPRWRHRRVKRPLCSLALSLLAADSKMCPPEGFPEGFLWGTRGQRASPVFYPPALAAGSETSPHGRGPSASSVGHSSLPFSGHHRGHRARGAQFTPLGRHFKWQRVPPSASIFGYSCKSRISHPRLSLNIKAPRGLTIPRSRSSNFEVG